MTPPINIDGTQITGASIDGTDVSEITVDGTQVFKLLPDSGVARWTFDDADTSGSTAIDVFGNNDGTINGATTGVSGANQTFTTNEAYSFDGTDDFVDIPANFGIFTGDSDYTFSAWVNFDNIRDQAFVISVQGEADVKFGGREDGTYVFDIFGGSSRTVSGTYSANTWDNWVAVFDQSSGMSLYKNGTEVDSNNFTGSANGQSRQSAIGAETTTFDSHVEGDIDDVRIYDKALSSTEINNLHNNGSI